MIFDFLNKRQENRIKRSGGFYQLVPSVKVMHALCYLLVVNRKIE